jgi:hypothetical protein
LWAVVALASGQTLMVAAPVIGLLCGRAVVRGSLGHCGGALPWLSVSVTALGILFGMVWSTALLLYDRAAQSGRTPRPFDDPVWLETIFRQMMAQLSSTSGLFTTVLLVGIGLAVAFRQAGPLRLLATVPSQVDDSVATRPWSTNLLSLGFCLWVYAGHFGSYAVAASFLAVIVVHEGGHLVLARWFGLRAGKPLFIPYIGAFVTLHDRPRSSWADACVGWGGPITGILTGGIPLLMALAVDDAELRGVLVQTA